MDVKKLLEKPTTILGAGACGQAFAADYILAGRDVRLYELPEFAADSLGDVLDTHEIHIGGDQINFKWFKRSGTARVDFITTDISKALRGAGVIILTIPSKGHKTFFEKMIPSLEDGQIISIFPDNFGSLVLREMMRERGCDKEIIIGGWNSMPYGVRKMTPGFLNMNVRPHSIMYETLPSKDRNIFYEALKDIPALSGASVIEHGDTMIGVGLSNPNPVVHTPGSILSVGPMEVVAMEEMKLGIPKGKFSMYLHGMSPAISKVQYAFYQELRKIADAMGIGIVNYTQADFFTKSSIMGKEFFGPFWDVIVPAVEGPDSVEHRYFTEDIPVGTAVYYNLAKKLGVDVPIIESILKLGSIVCGHDFFEEGRSLKEMGLERMNTKQIIEYLREGVRPSPCDI